jgi:hypothetical protein
MRQTIASRSVARYDTSTLKRRYGRRMQCGAEDRRTTKKTRKEEITRKDAEAQCISFPGLLCHRDQSEVTLDARKALLETANRFDLPKPMAHDSSDRIAHGIRNTNVLELSVRT